MNTTTFIPKYIFVPVYKLNSSGSAIFLRVIKWTIHPQK